MCHVLIGAPFACRYELPTHLVDHDVERQSLALYGTEALEALECACGPYRNVTRLQVCCVGIEDAMLYLSKVSTTLPNMAVSGILSHELPLFPVRAEFCSRELFKGK